MGAGSERVALSRLDGGVMGVAETQSVLAERRSHSMCVHCSLHFPQCSRKTLQSTRVCLRALCECDVSDGPYECAGVRVSACCF